MKAWFREDVFRRVLRNTGMLGVGKAAGALLHLATLGLTARLLGPYAFGLLILVRSYAQAASGLAKFQSWQTLIRFGAVSAERRDIGGFRDLVSFTVLIDGATGLIGAAAAFLLAPMLGGMFGIDPDSIWLAQLYCLAIPVLTSATPVGVLRIFDRFDWFAWQSIANPTLRLAGIGVAYFLGAPLWGYVVTWLVSELLGELVLWLGAVLELKRRGFAVGSRPSPKQAMRTNPGIARFALATNLGGTLNHAAAPLYTLLVGGLLGTTAAGIYRTAQIVIDAAATPADLAMRSLFPEATRLRQSDGKHFWRIMTRTLVLSCALGLVLSLLLLLAGSSLLLATMGPEYAEASTVLRIFALGFVAIVAAFSLETAMLAIGAAGRLLAVRAVGAATSFALLALLAYRFGLSGAAAAVTLGSVVTAIGMGSILFTERRRESERG